MLCTVANEKVFKNSSPQPCYSNKTLSKAKNLIQDLVILVFLFLSRNAALPKMEAEDGRENASREFVRDLMTNALSIGVTVTHDHEVGFSRAETPGSDLIQLSSKTAAWEREQQGSCASKLVALCLIVKFVKSEFSRVTCTHLQINSSNLKYLETKAFF